jgi:hypothetical protein
VILKLNLLNLLLPLLHYYHFLMFLQLKLHRLRLNLYNFLVLLDFLVVDLQEVYYLILQKRYQENY